MRGRTDRWHVRTKTAVYRVPVPCEFRYSVDERCTEWWPDGHVHQPLPCEYGSDDRHHAYLPPKWVALDIAGRRRRIKVACDHALAETVVSA